MNNLIGFYDKYNEIYNRYKSNNLSNSILIHGLKGIGKRTFVDNLIRDVLNNECKNQNLDHHINLFKNNSHPNIKIIEKEIDNKTNKIKSYITIDQIRKIKPFLNSTSILENTSKIIIIDTADDLNINSANSILKILEEPKENTYIFLLSNQISSLLPTIRSRCLKIKLNNHTFEDFTKILKNNIESISNEELYLLFELTFGSPGLAIAYHTNDFQKIINMTIKCFASNSINQDKIDLSNILSKYNDDEFINYLSILKFLLIIINKIQINENKLSINNIPNYNILVNVSKNLSKKNIIDRFNYLINNQNELFSLNLDKKIFILNFLTQ